MSCADSRKIVRITTLSSSCCHDTVPASYLFPVGDIYPTGTMFTYDWEATPEDSNYAVVKPLTKPDEECAGILMCDDIDTMNETEMCPQPLCKDATLFLSGAIWPEDWTPLDILKFKENCRLTDFKIHQSIC